MVLKNGVESQDRFVVGNDVSNLDANLKSGCMIVIFKCGLVEIIWKVSVANTHNST